MSDVDRPRREVVLLEVQELVAKARALARDEGWKLLEHKLVLALIDIIDMQRDRTVH